MNYTLSPKDMSSTQLSNDLIQLIEEMARNVYEVWAVTHIAQGWTWGLNEMPPQTNILV